MILVSIDIEYRYKLIEQIRKFENKIKAIIFTTNDIKYNLKYKKCDFAITEYNVKTIEYFLKLKKNIIICCFDEELVKEEYLKNQNVFICRSKKEVVDLILTEYSNKSFRETKFYRCIKVILYFVMFSLFFALIFKRLYFCKEVTHTKNKKAENSEKVDLKKENYLFLGDSITDFYDLKRYYSDLPVVNSGISGNKCDDILNDLEQRVFKYNPSKIFLLIGTNDIAFTDITEEKLANQIIEICDRIKEKRPHAEIYIESIYPVNKNINSDIVYTRDNERIKKINKLLQKKIKDKDYKYIDIYSLLKDSEDNLKIRYTYDGLHISHEGYKIITKEIKKIIYNN